MGIRRAVWGELLRCLRKRLRSIPRGHISSVVDWIRGVARLTREAGNTCSVLGRGCTPEGADSPCVGALLRVRGRLSGCTRRYPLKGNQYDGDQANAVPVKDTTGL